MQVPDFMLQHPATPEFDIFFKGQICWFEWNMRLMMHIKKSLCLVERYIYIYKKKRYKHKWRNEISPVWPASVPTRSRVPWMWSVWPESNSPERLKTCRHTRGKTFSYNNARHSCAGHTNTTECRKKNHSEWNCTVLLSPLEGATSPFNLCTGG